MTTISAIVPATNRPPTLARCLRAIHSAGDPPEEVIVCDTPATAGPAAARNAGARRATGDVLVFVDADVEPQEDAFRRIRRRFESDGELTAVFGSYDDRPSASGAVSLFRNLLHHHVHQASAGPASTFWAGLGAIRREAFLEAGGFDESLFKRPSVEDVELGMRLVDAGHRIELDPELLGTHLKRWTLRAMVRTDLLDRGVPWVGLLLRRRSASTALNLGWTHRAGALFSLALVAALVSGRLRAAASSAVALLAVHRSFYALLLRRGGATAAALGLGLHVVHHLTGLAAAALAVARHLATRRPSA